MAVHFFPEVNAGGTGSLDDYIALAEKGSANGVATLDGTSKIPSDQLPNLSITDTFVVGSQPALLALTAQVGDVAIRTDLNKSFILQSEPASVLGNWLELLTPPDSVLSVDGRTGVVSLSDLYQPKTNELTALSALDDVPGIVRKVGNASYTLDANTYLTANQTITLSGDVTGSGTTSINATLPNVVTAGSSAKPTYNAKGLITGSGSLVASDIPALDATKITNTAVTLSDTQTVTGQKTLTGGVIINDTIVESSISATELFTSWQPATGWTVNGGNATHTTGVVAINATVGTITANEVYQLVVTITNRNLGSVVVTFGGNTLPAITATTTVFFPAINSTSPGFTPTTDFDGSISLSVRLITPSTTIASGLNGVRGRLTSSFMGVGSDRYRVQNTNNSSLCIGINSGISNTTGTNWVAIGNNAGRYNTSGNNWSAFGSGAGFSSLSGSNWVAFGVNAGRSSTSNSNWTALGGSAGFSNTVGIQWTAVGMNSGYLNVTGSNWVSIGMNAGFSNIGSSNIFLGFEAGYNSTNESNCLYIGNNRNFDFIKGDNINQASTAVLRVNGTVASTSTTTGALVVSGGIGCQALFATTLNGAGSGLTSLNASNLSSGTIPDARLAGNYSGISALFRPGTTNALFLRGGNETLGSGSLLHLYGKDILGGQAYLDTSTMNFRNLDGTIVYGFINANGLSINASTASSSTTTGAVTVLGGVGVQGDIYANLFNGNIQLKTYTTATRPVPSASTVGRMWLNTDTGKIEYVATASTIQVITSA